MSEHGPEAVLKEVEEKNAFLDLIAHGVPPLLAAHELRWHPRYMKGVLADPEFAELMEAAIERSLDGIEATLNEKARKGNMAAIQMVLFNRRPERWRDVRRIEVHQETTVTVQQVGAVKQAALAILAERGAAAMQALGAPTAEGEIVDADVVGD